MKVGDLVNYIGTPKDELFFPEVKTGVLLSNVNEVGKVKVCFGDQVSWVWVGYLSAVFKKNKLSR